jgi:carbamoyltransferase
MYILGLSYSYHDAAACLLRDGVPVAAAEEERFTRVKHDHRFPENAIRYCLAEGRIVTKDLAGIAFYEKPARKLERALVVGKSFMPRSAENVLAQYPSLIEDGFGLAARLDRDFGYTGPLYFSEHHHSHAASAFFASPFEDAAVLTVDGVGEWATCTQFEGASNALVKNREIHYPHSLGLLYSTLTAYLGFRVNDDEYKVMGLASYGEPKFRRELEKLVTLFDDGSFALDLDFFSFMYERKSMWAEALETLLGRPRRREAHIEARHRDIAASLQALVEQAMIGLARAARATSKSANLCLAGGVAYNCVANAQVKERGGFERLFIQPAAGDSGAAMGAALWAHHEVLGAARTPRVHDTLLGPQFSDAEIKAALDASGVSYTLLDEGSLCARVAKLISANMIVGWFQGRMEFGPRALGGRSILANACAPAMKDILNARVKFREDFRPFAPAVLEEAAATYFEMTEPSPFMLLTPRVRPEWRARLPSVTHVDGTARVQTVAAAQNPRFHRLIAEFGKLSGIPVVINTSFNIRGEPIVCTPADALKCFLGTDIDFLAIGNFLVAKG